MVADTGQRTYYCLMLGRFLVGDTTPTDPDSSGPLAGVRFVESDLSSGQLTRFYPWVGEDVLRSSLGRDRPLDDLSCIGAIFQRNSWGPGSAMSYIRRAMCWMNSCTVAIQRPQAITSFKTYRPALMIICRAMFCWAWILFLCEMD
ncbi:hypothetical protein EVAR_24627_1 [Eumeta japonica]|uniref:Uncharacterized protein n=1 Tax=Eumeta variegata TaxID=151549 RepID=A0A4C1V127_EUMVA|nr:hypothetical protein EVAR_24627_1 [Eumeta japonica]